ncbi:MAG TPA: hypothetical protein VF938_09910 [Candidatus Angelobacter sp.]
MDLVVELPFDVGSLRDLVADMDVHASLGGKYRILQLHSCSGDFTPAPKEAGGPLKVVFRSTEIGMKFACKTTFLVDGAAAEFSVLI